MLSNKGIIRIEDKDDFTIMYLDGTFNSEEQNKALQDNFEKLASEDKNRIIIDFTDVFYFNSIAIRGLMTGRKKIKAEGGNIVFCNLGEYVENIFKLTRLNVIFKFCDSLEEASKEVVNENLS